MQISDTGIGIEKKDLPKIFDRFYRVDSARTEANDGIGLGLPIAKWLAELYGGKILIEVRSIMEQWSPSGFLRFKICRLSGLPKLQVLIGDVKMGY